MGKTRRECMKDFFVVMDSSSHSQPQQSQQSQHRGRPTGHGQQTEGRQQATAELVDYYSVLEISRDATDEDIRRAYRKQALRWHPDKNHDHVTEAEQQFKLVGEAYQVLRDPREREVYNDKLLGTTRQTNDNQSRFNPWMQTGRQDFNHWRPHLFQFHDPFELFAEFFGRAGAQQNDPFSQLASGRFGMFPDPFASDPFFQRQSSAMQPIFNHSISSQMMLGDGGNRTGNFSSMTRTTGGGGGGRSTFTEVRVVNGQRTETVTITDDRGNTRTETTMPDGTKRLLINGVEQRQIPTSHSAIESGQQVIGSENSNAIPVRIIRNDRLDNNMP